MKTRFFSTAVIAITAFTIIFNSCVKEDEEQLSRPLAEDEMNQFKLLDDGCVVTSLDNLFYYDEEYRGLTYYVGVAPDDVEQEYNKRELEPYTKYYWKLRNYDFIINVDGRSWTIQDTYAESEVRSFYYVPKPEIVDLHNVEGDWATVVKWNTVEGGQIHDIQVTMTPDKDCNYDKAPIEVPAGQDSCYISAGDLGNPKYQIYHNWWDEANGKYYEPVVYDYKVTISYDISGDIIPVSATKKGIFLNTDGYAADDYFNVYRYGKIGNRIWMLDDLRGLLDDTTLYYIVKLESGLEVVLYFEMAFMDKKYDKIFPRGFHLSTNEDWLDMEEHFGVNDDSFSEKVQIFNQVMYKYILDSVGRNSVEENMWCSNKNIYDYYAGKGTGIRDYLISDNEWKDINNPTVRLEGKGHITGFNAHPAGIPYISDFEKIELSNPYVGYGVSFHTPDWEIILWSGCDGIARRIGTSYFENFSNDRDALYSLMRCVKDE